ncbi:MAG: sulfur carrier protein ThiS [bacterium]
MNIQLNGESRQLPDESSIAQLVAELDLGDKRYAVEVNESVIPRSRHAEHLLQEGDVVEIVHAIGGG